MQEGNKHPAQAAGREGGENMENSRLENLETTIRVEIAQSGCSYREVIQVMEKLSGSYRRSAFNRIVKREEDDWTKAT